MRPFFRLFALALFLLPSISSATRLTVLPEVGVLPQVRLGGVQVEDCDWSAQLVKTLSVAVAKGNYTQISGHQALQLSLALRRRDVAQRGLAFEADVGLRVGLLAGGHMIASTDAVDEREGVKAPSQACDALRAVVPALVESIGDWLSEVQVPQCAQDCEDVLPDQPLFVAASITEIAAGVRNDAARDECRWLDYMPAQIAGAFNQLDKNVYMQAPPLIVKKNHQPAPGVRTLILKLGDARSTANGSSANLPDLRGELYAGRMLLGSFQTKPRSSTFGSAFGASLCNQLVSLSDKAAEAIAEWLKLPRLDAQL
ncbi:hypothetical protein [Uliginosibacterium sediminicola]|uniref:Uncharacterized protein n=1 Tax=Uliginosibacterium sediminicola TaxID=2024550 RepID=A0ABU9Z0U4_9RHOO